MRFARRTKATSSSIFDVIIEHLQDPKMISFSGGFPAVDLLPHEALKEASQIVFEKDQASALTYSSTWGYQPLREWIAKRYQELYEMDIKADEILITTGSQQALDLIGKVFLDPMDHILVEKPSYLGALQSFQLFEPSIHEVTLSDEGMNTSMFRTFLRTYHPKLVYTVPNFQNPSGISYSEEVRLDMVDAMKPYDVIMVEDDPYGDFRYEGNTASHFKKLAPDQTILLGSFSKIIAPGLRCGWLVAPKEILDKLYTAKEACDLHSSNLDQRIIYEYLTHNNLDQHISNAKNKYKENQTVMLKAIKKYFPSNIKISKSEGGMFLWCTGPSNLNVMELFEKAVVLHVLIMPGQPFYATTPERNTFRLNYTNVSKEQIEEGISILGALINGMI